MFIRNWFERVLRAPEDGTGADTGGDTAPQMDSLREVMAFDPFAPPAKTGTDGGEGGDQGGEPSVSGKPPGEGGDPASASPPPPAPSPTPSGPASADGGGDDPLADLRAQVSGFLAKAQAPQADTPTAPTPAAAAPKAPDGGPAPSQASKYNFELPDSIVEAFESDDRPTRKAALNAIVNSLANKLATDFGGALTALMKHVEEQIPQKVLTQVDQRSTFEGIKKDFYEAFPELAKIAKGMPGAEAAMWNQIHSVGQQMKIADWTPEFRDGVGQMLHLNLGIPVVKGKGASPEPASAPKPKPRAPFSAGGGGGGSRPNGAAGGNEFSDVLGATGT